jgi:ABC-type transporter Mla maintaining outer membrane lipid asymmetry ATPase subunit MlaF
MAEDEPPASTEDAAAKPILALRGLGKLRLETPLRVWPGDMLALVVASHTLREVLIGVLAGERTTEPGKVEFDGCDLADAPPLWKRQHPPQITIIARGGGLLANFNAWENIWIPVSYHHPQSQQALANQVEFAMQCLGLEMNCAQQRPGELSQWQRQAIACVRALLLGPKLMVLDALFDEADEEETLFAQRLLDALPTLLPQVALMHVGAELASALVHPRLVRLRI